MKNFIRIKEDFVCEHCGFKVRGNGYTDHCPNCLWGKHMDDKIPGDRAADCQRLMEPIAAMMIKGEWKIRYQCEGCGHEFTVRTDKNDDRELLIKLVNI